MKVLTISIIAVLVFVGMASCMAKHRREQNNLMRHVNFEQRR